jgi:hypothetical protein
MGESGMGPCGKGAGCSGNARAACLRNMPAAQPFAAAFTVSAMASAQRAVVMSAPDHHPDQGLVPEQHHPPSPPRTFNGGHR